MKTDLRKGFYFLDLIIVSIYIVFVWHCRYDVALFGGSLWHCQWMLLLYPLLLRATADFLLYRREKRAVWTILAFMVTYIGLIPAYETSYQHLVWFPFVLCDTQNAAASLHDVGMYSSASGSLYAIFVLLAWIVLMPIGIYLTLLLRKKLSRGKCSWMDVFGLMMYRDHAGRTYLGLAAIMFLAYTSGLYSVMFISKVALYVLPAMVYYVINRYVGRQSPWYEIVAVIAAMILFNEAQFQINGSRIAFLTISAAVVMVLCIWMGVKSRKVSATVLTFVLVAFVIPSVSVGYNVYRVINESVLCPYQEEYVNRGVFVTSTRVNVRGQEMCQYGLRDRYRTIFPAIYDRVKPYDWNNHLVELTLPNGTVVYNTVTQNIVHSFTSQDNNLRDYLRFTICEKLQDDGFDAGQLIVMETNTGKIKAMVDFGQGGMDNFSAVHHSGLLRPVAMLAALETGKVKMTDRVDVESGVYGRDGVEIKDGNWRTGGCGLVSLSEGLAQGSDIATYLAVEKAFGKSPDSFWTALNSLEYCFRDSISGIDDVKGISFPKYEYGGNMTNQLVSEIISGTERPVTPIQMLGVYNMILNEGREYETLLYEDSPSCRFDIAKAKNTRAVKAAMDKNFLYSCKKAGIVINDVSGYSAYHHDGDSYSEDFCGYCPKRAPKYTFILSLTNVGSYVVGKSLHEAVRDIAHYLNTGEEALPHYSESLRQQAKTSRLAQYQLGLCYDGGFGVKTDANMAVKWYRQSAANGYALAQWQMYLLYTDKGQTGDRVLAYSEGAGFPWLVRSAMQGYSCAQFSLGSAYAVGDYPPPSGISAKEESMKWFRLAAKNGDGTAREYLHDKK